MTKGKHRLRMLFAIAVGCLLLSSACLLFVPIAHNRRAPTMICSGLFWGLMLLGYGLFWMINYFRKKQVEKPKKRRVGIITFFQNIPAKCADCTCIAGIVLLLLSGKLAFLQGYIQYVLSFLVLFSFHMHCVLNGEVYRYIHFHVGRDNK